LDGGDVCQAEDHFFIGISGRTNPSGAQQLASYLESDGYSASYVDLQDIPGLLHLKSGIAYLGDGRLVLVEELQEMAGFEGFEVIHVDREENYAANCVRVNDTILAAEGFPRFADRLTRLGYQIQLVDVSEFQKMDGGLSCLSLRF
jgi:dimethylargininase